MEPKILPPGSGQPIKVLGDHMTIRLTGADTNDAFTLVEQNNMPGVAIPMHVHANEDELFHVVEGSMSFTVGGKTTIATAGMTIFLPRNIPHMWSVVGEGTARTLLQVFPAGAEAMWMEISKLAAGGPPDMEKVLAICERYGVTFPQP